jgi:PAP2 superfamily
MYQAPMSNPLLRALQLPKVDTLPHPPRRDTPAWLPSILRPPGDLKVPVRLLVACVVAGVATAVCYFLLVHTAPGQRLDDAAYHGAVNSGSQHFRFIDAQLRRIDERSLKLTMVAMFGIGLLRGRPLLGLGGAVVAGGPVAAGHVLRYHILNHPPFVVGSGIDKTFPSDHAAAAAGIAMALVLVSPPWLRGVVAIAGGVFAAAVAAQVQVIGWHRASDCIGACLIAFVFASGVAGILAWARPGRARKKWRHWWALVVMTATTIIALTLGALSARQGIGPAGSTPSAAVEHHAYLASVQATIGLVALLLAALLLLLGDADFDAGWPQAIVAALDVFRHGHHEAEPGGAGLRPPEVTDDHGEDPYPEETEQVVSALGGSDSGTR